MMAAISTDPKRVDLALVLYAAQKPQKNGPAFVSEYCQYSGGGDAAEGGAMFTLAENLFRDAGDIEASLREEARRQGKWPYDYADFGSRMLEKYPFLTEPHLRKLHGYAYGENWRD